MSNKNLHDSMRNKQDEFYTKLTTIEEELSNYRQYFKDKVVLCNCDDPYESNFFKYFAMNFNELELKKLIATSYAESTITYTQLNLFSDGEVVCTESSGKSPYKVEITEVGDVTGNGSIDLADVEYLLKNDKNIATPLKGNGDFRSEECVELLKEADIVVTNPPFSLFREYIAQLMKYKKQFLIIGRIGAISYKETLPLFMNDEIWLGYHTGHYWFKVPDYYEPKKTDFKIDENGQKWRRMGNICWFTNLDVRTRHENYPVFATYDPNVQPKYDHYDAIDVGRKVDIPCDYFESVGVPMSFLDKYDHDRFRLYESGMEIEKTGNEYKMVVSLDKVFIAYPSGKKEGLIRTLTDEYGYSEDELEYRNGIMGITATFMADHNPEQFEMLGTSRYHDGQDYADDINYVNGAEKFSRVLMRRIMYDD